MGEHKHVANLTAIMKNELLQILETETQEHIAFVRLSAKWLGYIDLEDDQFTDGADERGIDFWYESDSGFEMFQVKSHKLGPMNEIDIRPFDKDGVMDLVRIKNFMSDPSTPPTTNTKINLFRQQWESAIMRRQIGDTAHPLHVGLNLVLFGEGLTGPAQEEFDSIAKSLRQPIDYKGVKVEFRVKIFTITDILIDRWRQDNRDWLDKSGRKSDYISLRPQPFKEEKTWISRYDNVIFYCKAVDLINAYNEFGYQIFEPNVRAHVGKTKVNMAIKESL
jgi:hypothetical protein